MKRGIITIIICALSFWTLPARAELVTIQITGEVDFVGDPYGYFEGKIKVGDIITGFYTYESTTPDSNPIPQVADYLHRAAPCGISLTVGGFEFKTDPASVNFLVEITNNYPPNDDYFLLSRNNIPLSNGTLIDEISWWLYDPTGNALSSDALLITAPILDNWQSNSLGIHGPVRGNSFGIVAHVTSAVLIPELATILLFGLGLSLLRKRT